MNNINSNRNWY